MRKASQLAVLAAASGLAVSLVGTASADGTARPGDVIGVGSDTLQNIGNFLTDGNPALSGGILAADGYNNAGNVNRVISFDATPDDNDRTLYYSASNGGGQAQPTVVLRAGTFPQQRPNGSGGGIAALLADTGSPETINFVRMSRLPKSTEEATAVNNGWGGLRVVKIATDDLVMAAATTTNAVPLTAAQLVHVYQCDAGFTDWNSLNASAPVGSTIVPLKPQTSSGTYSTFNADLVAANGGNAVNYGPCVVTSEENDPNAITGLAGGTAANAIEPMSSGRKKLFDNGYFHNPATAFPGGAALTSGIQLLYGSGGLAQTPDACVKPTNPAGTGNSLAFCDTRGLYIVWRESDTAAAGAFQPGGTRNWVSSLFYTGTTSKPYVQTTGGQANIAAAGVTPTYVSCGVNPTSC